MKISGFTFIRHGVQFGYPFLESIRSLLPWVDELVINVGKGTDATYDILSRFSQTPEGDKLKLFESDWQIDVPEKKKGGLILSEQTNLALEHCAHDWCIYLQADEVLHEQEMPTLIQTIQSARPGGPLETIEGITLNYLHFYGSYNVVQHSRSAYRREVRVIRKSSGATSIGDAQSFRKKDGSKLQVIPSNTHVYHYGWVRPPETMKEKTFFFDQLYHGSPTLQDADTQRPHTGDNYRYKKFWGLKPYTGTHPATMQARIAKQGWHWDLNSAPMAWSWSDSSKILLDSFEHLTGIRLFEYRSYRLLSPPHAPAPPQITGRKKVSVTLITQNEETCIEKAIQSVAWADEIIVVDSGSTDRTVHLAKQLGARVATHAWEGYGQQKNFAQSLASHDWVLNLDADEIISEPLAQAIQKALSEDSDTIVAYEFPRKTYFLGRWIRHGGWYPNYLTRLAHRKYCEWTEPPVHEQLIIKSNSGDTQVIPSKKRIHSPILHDAFQTIDDQILTNLRFARLGAQELQLKNCNPSLLKLIFKPLGKFLETYFLKKGVLDGLEGFIISVNAAHSMFLKHAFFLTQQKTTSNTAKI